MAAAADRSRGFFWSWVVATDVRLDVVRRWVDFHNLVVVLRLGLVLVHKILGMLLVRPPVGALLDERLSNPDASAADGR